jgi:7,8-dihydroneopterin aldolase/epimerase/oxygenase
MVYLGKSSQYMKWTISLENIEIFAHHGWYDEERITGNTFIVDINLILDLPDYTGKDDLNETVNYEKLYEIAIENMSRPRKLLESICWTIKDDLLAVFGPNINGSVKIVKLNPPVKGKVGKSSVKLEF